LWWFCLPDHCSLSFTTTGLSPDDVNLGHVGPSVPQPIRAAGDGSENGDI
jgi:hypothetical protein